MISGLLKEITSRGDSGAVVPVSRFDDLKAEMEELRSDAHHAFSDWMAGNMALPRELSFEPRSLISVITPSPKVRLQFYHRDTPVNCILPPYYTDECIIGTKVLQYINAYLTPLGFMAAEAGLLPEKLLAVHSGLTLYGRNNICFSERLGSHMRILAFVSDLPCEEETPWFPARRMDTCSSCTACAAACPTKAIDPAQGIINATVCLTAMNEVPGNFPDWVPGNAHNSVVGCIKCQDACPCNAHVTDSITSGVAFTAEETAELLHHTGDTPLSTELHAKIDAAGINPDYIPLLNRNLGVLLR